VIGHDADLMPANNASARVESLLRYPVKSMLGEEVDASIVGERGLLGDRAYALVDQESGKVASAKNPRLWGMLFQCRAAYVAQPGDASALPAVRLTMPDGESVDSDDPKAHELLSRVVGRPVRLEARPPDGAVYESYSPVIEGIPEAQHDTVSDEHLGIVAPGTFFDAAPMHLVTTATLARLRELAPQSSFEVRRFRPNMVVAVDGPSGFVENDWVGHTLRAGDVSMSVFLSAPRCVMTTLAQDGLPRDRAVLHTIAHHNRFDIPGLGPSSCVGVYALVTTGGSARRGDPVEIT
jgi:MOSC domain-containing protein